MSARCFSAAALLAAVVVSRSLAAHAAIQNEDFTTDPVARGWGVRGDSTLFRWEPRAGALKVTWDSRRTNSFLARRLDTVLTRRDDFRLGFDLQLDRVVPGIDPTKAGSFQLCVAFIGLGDATRSNHFRGAGVHPVYGTRNAVEFVYFPDAGFGATVAPTLISKDNEFASSFTFPLELATGAVYRVEMEFAAATATLSTRLSRDGVSSGPIKEVRLAAGFSDFAVDTVAVCSYSDASQDPPEFAGSILAHGWLDNLFWEVPVAAVQELAVARTAAGPRVSFMGQTGWDYQVERSGDSADWRAIGAAEAKPGVGASGLFEFVDAVAPVDRALYRIRATRQ